MFTFFYVGLAVKIDFDFSTVGRVVEGNLETETERLQSSEAGVGWELLGKSAAPRWNSDTEIAGMRMPLHEGSGPAAVAMVKRWP